MRALPPSKTERCECPAWFSLGASDTPEMSLAPNGLALCRSFVSGEEINAWSPFTRSAFPTGTAAALDTFNGESIPGETDPDDASLMTTGQPVPVTHLHTRAISASIDRPSDGLIVDLMNVHG